MAQSIIFYSWYMCFRFHDEMKTFFCTVLFFFSLVLCSHLSLLCLSLPIYFSITHLSSALIQYILSHHSCFLLCCTFFKHSSLYCCLFWKTLPLPLSVSDSQKHTTRTWTFKRNRKAELSLSSLATTNWCPSKKKRRRVCVCVSGCLCAWDAVHNSLINDDRLKGRGSVSASHLGVGVSL